MVTDVMNDYVVVACEDVFTSEQGSSHFFQTWSRRVANRKITGVHRAAGLNNGLP